MILSVDHARMRSLVASIRLTHEKSPVYHHHRHIPNWAAHFSTAEQLLRANMVDVALRRAAHVLCLFVMLTAGLTSFASSPTRAQDELSSLISSQRYIVIDAETGEIFAEQGSHDQVAIASLTKIFTTIEAIERAPLTTEIVTDESDLFDASSTTMGFGPGETFTLEDLLYGMMLPSGNDAAHAIARSLGAEDGDTPEQSVQRFVGYMNERIRNMGLTETTLVNPHGLGVPGHHSSAHDIAAFTRYALQYPVFVQIISTAEYNAGGYVVTNTNRLLGSYAGLIGGKTGYDEDSGYCLVEIAERNGDTMISVTLDGVAPDIWYQDNAILLDYAFEQKAAREAAGRPISGEIVAYRDPDAAAIAQMVTPGASIGQAEPEQPTPQTAVVPTPTETVDSVDVAEATGGGTSRGSGAALLVVAIVLAACVAYRLMGFGQQQPVTDTVEAPPGPTQPDEPRETPDDPPRPPL